MRASMRIPFAGAQCALLEYDQMAEVTLTFSEAIKRVAVACEGRQFREADRIASVVSHAMIYNMIRVCYAGWHVDEPRGIGDHA